MRFDSESEYNTPHSFRLGADLTLLDETLIVALDARYMLYSLSHEEVTTTLERDGMSMSSAMPLRWNDSFGIMLGAEYLIAPAIPVRLGYNLTPSATPAETASPFLPVPPLLHGFSAGIGLRRDRLDLDFAVIYAIASGEVETGMTAGAYESESVILSAAVSYHR
jgi:hypothetical protein